MTLRLFEATGVEIEYMIVDRETLDVRPLADELLRTAAGGEEATDVERGALAWGNELALHVVELKTAGPAPRLEGVAAEFQRGVRDIVEMLGGRGAALLPTGMHPWMDPERETHLWPHEYEEIYRTFDRIFGCRGHGWSNLQSVHINLPFSGDEEFARLHAAIRILLPILPAIAASSPFAEGRATGSLDTRLEQYRRNCRRIPSITGDVIPEPAASRAEYEERVLGPIYRDLAPLDPDGVLRHEWVNARGAIARFDRGSIEIRVLDVQECPAADLAVCAAAVAVLRALVAESLSAFEAHREAPTEELARILLGTVRDGECHRIEDAQYLRLLGYERSSSAKASELWRHLLNATIGRSPAHGEWTEALEALLSEGCLARRIREAAGASPSRSDLHRVYARLRDCLEGGEVFHAKG